MLTRFTGTLINNVPGDYIVRIEFDKVLEVSCRDEIDKNTKNKDEIPHHLFFLDIIFEGQDDKMSIPFYNNETRRENMDMFFSVSLDLRHRDLTQGFYSRSH